MLLELNPIEQWAASWTLWEQLRAPLLIGAFGLLLAVWNWFDEHSYR